MTGGNSTAIDFARSSVTWLLPEQPSYGRFSIDAALTSAGGETFYLCAQVFAGDVYGDGPLFHEPPYGFSAAFSSTRYRIFRDAMRGAAREDSYGEIGGRFREARVDVARRACNAINPAAAEVLEQELVARVQMPEGEIEFPVRHVNWRADGRFQVETGPVLVAVEGAGDTLERLRRAQLIMADPENVEILFDPVRPPEAGRGWAKRAKFACRSRLFGLS